METEVQIKNLIGEINFWDEEDFKAADWEHIVSSGILDSLAVVYLIGLLEEQFQIKIPLSNMKVEFFESVTSIKSIVENYRGKV